MYSIDDIYNILGAVECTVYNELSDVISERLLKELRHKMTRAVRQTIEEIKTDQSSGYSQWYRQEIERD